MKLPVLSGKEIIQVLKKKGFEVDHQTGSHMVLRLNRHPFTRVTIPNHKAIVPRTLISIMRQINVSREELQELI